MVKNFQDLTGQKFGRLTVLQKDIVKNDMLYWICSCICGTVKTIRGANLKNGATTSCGCYCREVHWKGCGELSGEYWSATKLGAKRRNLIFDITIEEAWDLFIKQNRKCALTGRELMMVRNYSDSPLRQTASLDRIDSNDGYTIKNVQWVHKDINIFKGAMHSNDFIALCNEVVEYQKSLRKLQ